MCRREVEKEEGAALAAEWGIPFIECSAKKNDSIKLVFTTIMMEIEKHSGLLDKDESNCVIQ